MSVTILSGTPASLGYRFPAEWEPHRATWLTYPCHETSFPGKMDVIKDAYHAFIRSIAASERVCINVHDEAVKASFLHECTLREMDMDAIDIFVHPSDDVWCRDHGPSFVISDRQTPHKAIVNWLFNAWGGKYPFENDNRIPSLIAQDFDYPMFLPEVVMEGGSIDTNGKGTLLTTRHCLLNPNRNPTLSQSKIEQYLCEYYNVGKVLWLEDGIAGDDTDGHVDDLVRFVNEDTVITVVEHKKTDENYEPLQQNLRLLSPMRLKSGKQMNIVELPMPDKVLYQDTRLPASYANFYITNGAVIVPNFRCKKDDVAMEMISECFPGRKIIGIDAVDIVWGLGTFHCLSQQEPSVLQPVKSDAPQIATSSVK